MPLGFSWDALGDATWGASKLWGTHGPKGHSALWTLGPEGRPELRDALEDCLYLAGTLDKLIFVLHNAMGVKNFRVADSNSTVTGLANFGFTPAVSV